MKWLKWIRSLFKKEKPVHEPWMTDEVIQIGKQSIEEFKQNEKATEEINTELPQTPPLGENCEDEKGQEEITVTKNEYRKSQLRKGFEARYSGKEKHFYLHKINFPCPN